MKTKVKKVVDEITEVLKTWEGLQAVILQHFVEKDIYDPNFSITLDVFKNEDIPENAHREAAFPDARYFESSRVKNKDRFILEDLPVRISYKDSERVDAVLAATAGESWMLKERGTYLFHRIATGTVVWSKGAWINGILEKLDNLPDSFWIQWVESCNRRIDHLLSDLGAASLKGDALYFNLSLSGFLKTIAEVLFAVNHVFEPGPRDYTASLGLLEVLPEGFEANWGSLLREDAELPRDRKREIAELLARGIFSLTP
ncbi:MAG: hypothetical protein DRP70_07065 [Spirochaetes bacterium]|nr:MAG: hypothetical protein DRP60_16225 [Spirochaetota bacterium]RKX88164.1 MAG: hypothetical protein DRP70_07065 [Spirochaetota bacterium]RKX94734.1 MAG: hypothetical protein DRZ90_11425 [Spirochaetota bacterium]